MLHVCSVTFRSTRSQPWTPSQSSAADVNAAVKQTFHSQCLSCAGIIDDIYGASFVNGAVSGDPMDQNGHGTFVAGVVGAVGNNGRGVTGNGWVSDAIQCIDYCISKDAHIMSNSWGGVAYSQALQVTPILHP